MTMRAAVYDRYGPPDVVRVRQIARPSPGKGDLLVRVRAATVSAGDWRLRTMDVPSGFKTISRLMFGVFKPRNGILGSDMAGEVAEVGTEATGFRPGDTVFASAMRTHAEFATVKADGAVVKAPAGVSMETAAALPFGGGTALIFLRDKAKVKAGDKVLVVGASGSVGSAAVQLAKHFGAEVTGVCSAQNADMVRSIGADHVIDYRSEDFTKNGRRYDIIVDTAGTASYPRAAGSLAKGGRLVQVVGGIGAMMGTPAAAKKAGHTTIAGVATPTKEHLQFLVDLVQAGRFKPLIEKTYVLDDIAVAHARVESKHKKGNLVVTMG
jgi:NADPH:quinone reductase-like Zn-dependent oxidoreductase